MKKLILGLSVFALILAMADASNAEPKIVGKTVEYFVQGVPMKSYLAYDESFKGRRPGVLVVPEAWGINDYVQKRARMLAELGYTALVVDMYGEGKQAMTVEEGVKLSSEVMKDFEAGGTRFLAAMDFLKRQRTVDPSRIAAIGYCFGGGVVLNMARQGVDLLGVVSFHGELTAVKPAQPGSVKAKVLVLTGGDDQFVPSEQVAAFKREMESAGADFRVISYPGAKHSFTNPDADALGKKFNVPIAYNAEADHKSWSEMKNFFKTIFYNAVAGKKGQGQREGAGRMGTLVATPRIPILRCSMK